ncbi:aminotransferase [Acinetobacter indicus]|nr:aminotransferase [Acinetobacter indicus]
MKLVQPLLFSALACLPIISFATVGGQQRIEVLGYDQKDQKVYLLRHYEDGRGRLPQLYYYNFKSKQPNQLVQVNSLYINPKTKKIDYDQPPTRFNTELAKIKNRLKPLTKLRTQQAQIKVLHSSKRRADWINGTEPVPQWQYCYQVNAGNFRSTVQQATSYKQGLNIHQAYNIPQQSKMLVTVKYLGIPFEMGYPIEDPVLLSNSQ